jgi:hypothetical protein
VSPIEAALLVVIVALPFHIAMQVALSRLEDPGYIRRKGVVIVRESALSGHEGCLGQYEGHEIWATVTFKGMTYRFSRVARPGYRQSIHERELYLDPGLVYLTD